MKKDKNIVNFLVDESVRADVIDQIIMQQGSENTSSVEGQSNADKPCHWTTKQHYCC